jgi:Lipopolysaccharide-assembly
VKRFLTAAAICSTLTGCFGYHIGPVKPYYLQDVRTIAVPTFKNETLLPRIEVLVTGTVIKQFQQDGTFQIGNEGNADVILKGEITKVDRSPARSLRGNVLATTEFNLSMHVRYKLVGRDGKMIGAPREATGTTSFFVGTDVTTDERQALPLATEELATRLVSQLSEGW